MREYVRKLLDKLGRERVRELVTYLIVGVMTTVVNYAVYLLVRLPFDDKNVHFVITLSEVVSWIVAVAFAYAANRLFVFRTGGQGAASTLREAGKFVSARLLSLVVDWLFVLAMAGWFGMDDRIAKIPANVIVIVANYFASRFWIFKKS